MSNLSVGPNTNSNSNVSLDDSVVSNYYADDVTHTQPQRQELSCAGKASGWALAGRILLGVFTLGISEGIRAIVASVRNRTPSEPKVQMNSSGTENNTTVKREKIEEISDSTTLEVIKGKVNSHEFKLLTETLQHVQPYEVGPLVNRIFQELDYIDDLENFYPVHSQLKMFLRSQVIQRKDKLPFIKGDDDLILDRMGNLDKDSKLLSTLTSSNFNVKDIVEELMNYGRSEYPHVAEFRKYVEEELHKPVSNGRFFAIACVFAKHPELLQAFLNKKPADFDAIVKETTYRSWQCGSYDKDVCENLLQLLDYVKEIRNFQA